MIAPRNYGRKVTIDRTIRDNGRYSLFVRKPLSMRKEPAAPILAAGWARGFVSPLMDISLELLHSLLRVFMAVSAFTIGKIDGSAVATPLIANVFTGGFPTGRVETRPSRTSLAAAFRIG